MPFFKSIQKETVKPLLNEFGNPAQLDVVPWRREANLRNNGGTWEELISAGWNVLADQNYYEPDFRVRGFLVSEYDQNAASPGTQFVLHYDLPWPNPDNVDGTEHLHGHYGWFEAMTVHPAYITRVRLTSTATVFSVTNAPMIKLVG